MRRLSIVGISLLAFASEIFAEGQAGYPAAWWQPVARQEVASWEILPQDAGPGEVILSKRTELGILSNFAPTPFELDGQVFASIEGFWQMMKYPEGPNDERAQFAGLEWKYKRAQVARMSAFEAKRAGDLASANMQIMGINWVSYQSEKLPYRVADKGAHYQLIRRAMMAKLEQNPEVARLLRATRGLRLRPDHTQGENPPPAWRYFDIWMELRD